MIKWLIIGGILAACIASVVLFLPRLTPDPVPTSSATNLAPVDVAALRSRAESGDANAQAQLGALYSRGESVANSYVEAANWYRKAAEQGNAEAQLALGELYEAGQGVPKDIPQALKLYRQAAEQGLARAQYTLGFMYEAGRGVRQNQVEAANWFKRAAEQGEMLSQYDLGQRYDLGVGVAVDRVEALKWLILAANQGQPDAAARRDKVKKQMTRAAIAEAQHRAVAFSASKLPTP